MPSSAVLPGVGRLVAGGADVPLFGMFVLSFRERDAYIPTQGVGTAAPAASRPFLP